MRFMTELSAESETSLSESRSELTRQGTSVISDLESALTDYCITKDSAILFTRVSPVLSGESETLDLSTIAEKIENLSKEIGDSHLHLNPVETKFKIYSAISAILSGLDKSNGDDVLVGIRLISMGTELLCSVKEKSCEILKNLVKKGDLSQSANLDQLPVAIAAPLSTITLLLPEKAQAIIKKIMPELVPDITIE